RHSPHSRPLWQRATNRPSALAHPPCRPAASACRRLAQRSPKALQLGYRIQKVVPGTRDITLVFSDGRRVGSDIVVAADGIRSIIRATLFAPDTPRFEGYVAWRGLVPMADLPLQLRSALGSSFGGGRFIVNYPVRRGELMNFVAI